MVGFEGTSFSKIGLSLRRVDPNNEGKIAEDISRLLIAASTNLMESNGGHVPDEVVCKIVHPIYASRSSVETTFAGFGHRFVVHTSEGIVVSTVLISGAPDIVLGFSGNEPVGTAREGLHPRGYHSIFNLAVAQGWRRKGIARAMFSEIALQYRLLFEGRGWWVRSEPPDHDVYLRLGFRHDTAHDGFVEGKPMPSAIFADAGSFNEKYWCKCCRSGPSEPPKSRKLRYWAFTQSWL